MVPNHEGQHKNRFLHWFVCRPGNTDADSVDQNGAHMPTTMTGQMKKINWKKHYEMLKTIPDSTEAPEKPRIKVDLRAALNYARQKEIDPASLTDAEKQMFMTPY